MIYFKEITFPKGSLSATSSPSRRFANRGMIRLDEIESIQDLNYLSSKQCKDLLLVNRVNIHGILEKEELIKIAQRLWKQEQKSLKGARRLKSTI